MLIGVVLMVALIGGGAYVLTQRTAAGPAPTSLGPAEATDRDTAAPTATATTTVDETAPTSAATAAPDPTATGLVTIDDPSDLATRVAAMFDTYFGGINGGNPDQALAVYDPAGSLDPGDTDEAAQFSHDISTTRDDDIVLTAAADHGSSVAATVSFRSHQDAGYGPGSNPNQTCTRWTVHYTLSDGSAGLRILKGSGKPTSC